jgi:hypothetical protein
VWIPTDGLTEPAEEPDDKNAIALVEPAPPGELTVVSIARTSPDVLLGPPDDVPSGQLACWPLRSGDLVWVVAFHVGYPDENRAIVDAARQEASAHVQEGAPQLLEDASHPRLILYLQETDGSYSVIDTSPFPSA